MTVQELIEKLKEYAQDKEVELAIFDDDGFFMCDGRCTSIQEFENVIMLHD